MYSFLIRYYYKKSFNPDNEVAFSLYETIETMVPNQRIRFEIDKQLMKFKYGNRLLGVSMALESRHKKQPGNFKQFTIIFMSS